MSVVFAVSGCGGGGDEDGGSPQGWQASTGPVDTQPGAPCARVPDALVDRIEKQIIPASKMDAAVWQMVRSEKSYPNGLKEPSFISASVTVDKNPPAVATWTVEDRNQPVIPLDGIAKDATTPQEGIDPTEYSGLLTKKDYVKSRACAQEAFALEQELRQLRREKR